MAKFKNKRSIWFFAVLAFKLLVMFFCLNMGWSSYEGAALASGTFDSPDYILPIEGLLSKGSYLGWRMPGYGAIYFFIRLLFAKTTALNVLVIFQLILDAIAVIFLATKLESITKSKVSFYLTIILYGLGITVSTFNNWILTESFSASFLILSFCFILDSDSLSSQKRKRNSLLAGLFIAIAYFHRPIFAPILAIGIVYLLIRNKLFPNKFSIPMYLIFPLLFSGLWVARNIVNSGKPILLTERIQYGEKKSDYILAAHDFMMCYTDKMSVMTYFDRNSSDIQNNDSWRASNRPPQDLFTPIFTKDSLDLLEKEITNLFALNNIGQKEVLEKQLVGKIERYTTSIKSTHPFKVYLRAPINRALTMMKTSGIHKLYRTPHFKLSKGELAVKYFFILIYLITLVGFALSLFFGFQLLLTKSFNDAMLLLLPWCIFGYMLMIHVLAGYVVARYMVPIYPLFVMSAVLVYTKIISIFTERKLSPSQQNLNKD